MKSLIFILILVCGSLCEQAVQINATPSSEYLLKDSKNSLTVKLNISATPTPQTQTERPPFELAIVFDRSGSMYGEKIVHAKQSIKNIINNLTPKDRLHLVIYDDTVDVVFKDGTIEQAEELLRKVDLVYERGMTNLHGGLQRGYEMLSSSSKMVKRVFLFSDGLANSGITDPKTIFELAAKMHSEQSISTSAFGIGVDFDEPLMTGIAEHGNGDYFFIGNGGDTEKVVSIGLKGVTNLVADNVKLRVSGKNGASVTKAFGFPIESLKEGVKLSDIRQHTKRTIILQLEIDTKSSLANEDILEYELEYQVITTGKVEVVRGSLHVLFTDDRSLVDIKNTEIQELLELQIASEKEQEVRRALEQGDMERARIFNEEANTIYSRVASTSTVASSVFQAKVRKQRNVETAASISTGNIKMAEMQNSYYSSKNIIFDEADAEL